MIERFERFKKPVALAVISTLGLTACAADGEPTAAETTPTQEVTPVKPDSGYTRTAKYYDDGSRVLYVRGQLENDKHGSYSTDILQFCDGKDLVETALREWRSNFSTSISRSVGHSACADGKLTEADFPAAK